MMLKQSISLNKSKCTDYRDWAYGKAGIRNPESGIRNPEPEPETEPEPEPEPEPKK